MKKPIIVLLLLFCFAQQMGAQNELNWVYFTNKPQAPMALLKGQLALGERAVENRLKRNVAFDELDVAVESSYVNDIRDLGLEVVMVSRWLNAVLVKGDLPVALYEKPFVKRVEAHVLRYKALAEVDKLAKTTALNYGQSTQQIQLLYGEAPHNRGFTGRGMRIAVLDAGFLNVNQLAAFDSLRSENRIVSTFNFVNNQPNVYSSGGTHGTGVLSTMAANIPGSLVGTAPHAEYVLLTSENTSTETPAEEYNWLKAAEFADSLGCDVINSSLGYYEFDDASDNYTYNDLDGKTTIVTQAADWASKKGILVVNSAGNEGMSSWGRIIAPCDGDSVLCVGGVSLNGNYVRFSSRGPSADGRVKPNVVGPAADVKGVTNSASVVGMNGTSFSSPIIAGLAACIWQAYPNKNNFEILKAIEQSASRAQNPDSLMGYGIPNFSSIEDILGTYGESESSLLTFVWRANTRQFCFSGLKNGEYQMEVWTLNGKRLMEGTFNSNGEEQVVETGLDLPNQILLRLKGAGQYKVWKMQQTP